MNSSQQEVDKEQQYGEYMAQKRWQDALYRKGCFKALDIPENGMSFQQLGITGKHLILLGGMILAGLLGWRAIDKLSAPEIPPAASAPLAAPQEFEVTFWAEDGEPIQIERQEPSQQQPERP